MSLKQSIHFKFILFLFLSEKQFKAFAFHINDINES